MKYPVVVMACASLVLIACGRPGPPAAQESSARRDRAVAPAKTAPEPRASAVASPDVALAAPVVANLTDFAWSPGPEALPRGARMAVLEGQAPFPSGQSFTFVLEFPASYAVPPHSHPATERVTVLAGTLHFGHGTTLDRNSAKTLRACGIAMVAAGHHHFAFTTTEKATLLVQGVGPWGISYVNPADDPRGARPAPVAAASGFDAPLEPKTINADEVAWQPAPAGMLPPGASLVFLEGDLTQPKTFTARVKVPDGYRFPVHSHGVTDRPTVLTGALMLGIGDSWSDEAMTELRPGAVAILPKGLKHHAAAKGETTFQVMGTGPFDIVWADPADAPAKPASPPAG